MYWFDSNARFWGQTYQMIVFIIFSVVHVTIFIWLYFHWRRTSFIELNDSLENTFTIILPIRNEEANVENLLIQFDHQSYPKSQYEVIVVDDNSEDNSSNIVKSLVDKVSYKLIYLDSKEQIGKKSSITKGVLNATNDIIITIDGDCSVGYHWLKSHASSYIKEETVMIAGPVVMFGDSLVADFQLVEFSSLIGVGAAALNSGNPLTCNGANMSYRRKVFLEVNGYHGNEHIPSGDDEFLLQKIASKYPKGIQFLKNKQAIVRTPAKENFIELMNQRLRWSSKWKYHKGLFPKLSSLYFFLDYLVYLVAGVIILSKGGQFNLYLTIVALRVLFDLIFIVSLSRFFELSLFKTIFIGFILHVIYPVFVAFLGLASIFGTYSWKGRKY